MKVENLISKLIFSSHPPPPLKKNSTNKREFETFLSNKWLQKYCAKQSIFYKVLKKIILHQH
jgi:hypothetical protein